jgi:hypothetical protein
MTNKCRFGSNLTTSQKSLTQGALASNQIHKVEDLKEHLWDVSKHMTELSESEQILPCNLATLVKDALCNPSNSNDQQQKPNKNSLKTTVMTSDTSSKFNSQPLQAE